MRWFIYSFILRNPNASLCLLAILIVAVFSVMIGWPAYLFLVVVTLTLIAYIAIKDKMEIKNCRSFKKIELDSIERNKRWLMALLSFIALFGNITSFFVTIYSLRHDSSSSTTLGAMAVTQFIIIGIPYFMMNLVRRKSSLWYGVMLPVFLSAIVQFFALYTMLEFKDKILVGMTTMDYEFLKGEYIIAIPLLMVPVLLFMDSLGKAFGFEIKDNNMELGYNKEKHETSIYVNKRQSSIAMAISAVWSLLLLWYSYNYLINSSVAS